MRMNSSLLSEVPREDRTYRPSSARTVDRSYHSCLWSTRIKPTRDMVEIIEFSGEKEGAQRLPPEGNARRLRCSIVRQHQRVSLRYDEHFITSHTALGAKVKTTMNPALRYSASAARIGLCVLALLFARRMPAAKSSSRTSWRQHRHRRGVLCGSRSPRHEPHCGVSQPHGDGFDWHSRSTPSTISVPANSTVSVDGSDVFAPDLASSIQDHSFGAVFGAAAAGRG